MHIVLASIVGVVGVCCLMGLLVWWPRGDPQIDTTALGFQERVSATVADSEDGPCSYDPDRTCHQVTFELTSGPDSGATVSQEYSANDTTPASQLGAGDRILLNDAGPGTPEEGRYQFVDVQRGRGMLVIALVFAVAVVALGRWRGLLALAGIGLSVMVVLVFIFPALLRGSPPLAVALTGAGVIAFVTLYLAHGVNWSTTVALVGTFASLALTAALAVVAGELAQLSGLATEESLTLLAFAPDLDFRGLLLAAIIIGALGVLDDVTVTQASAVWELHGSGAGLTHRQLYAAGIRIGRDHIAATVNTLVLAYAAAALPLLLIFTQSGLTLMETVTSEAVAVEVVQTLVGSIGLVASVPITTALATWVATRSAGAADRLDFAPPPPPPAPPATPPTPPPTPRPPYEGPAPPRWQP